MLLSTRACCAAGQTLKSHLVLGVWVYSNAQNVLPAHPSLPRMIAPHMSVHCWSCCPCCMRTCSPVLIRRQLPHMYS